MTVLDSHRRGDTFEYSFSLGNGWVGADFTGGVKFTLSIGIPESSTVDDTDAVDQASVATGEITITGADGVILIHASRTTAWPGNQDLHWDLQGTVSGATPLVYTIDSGTILILGDVTRG